MKVEEIGLERKYHAAVEHWRRHNFKDYDVLLGRWEQYFPSDERFCLCAKMEIGMPDVIAIGEHQGEKKRTRPDELSEEEAKHLLAIIKAQASTEFGSIQQHAGTLERADDDQDRFWVLRVMAEELRHGYQMLHLLLSTDWSHVSGGVTGEQMVEEILSMQTGNHVLDAFNLDYDSFIDNIAFAALVDRVGKYQLTMQRVCAYKPMADSMPPMLREEAFHLAAGVIPMRRWAQRAAQGDPFITMTAIQHAINKWFPRALEMFGDERGGDTNVRFGFKDMKNREAQDRYIDEVRRMIRDINVRFIRARFPEYAPERAEQVLDDLERSRGAHQGVRHEDLLRMPDRRFFRRKGETAFAMIGVDGETFTDAGAYLRHLTANLNEGYVASRDMRQYAEALRGVAAGTLTVHDAIMKMPKLKRVGGTCPCSKGVRWVMEDSAADRAATA
ncbi:MAG: phenylacetate-CoA oxygenase subunit PaaI [Candidatus Eisenbacteria bacterium]|uniref:Phenylacetate-CoA oxygenase subunit PaaI n=1 Tax=Eiseniibacteriota bacterium TaxID=2212470 RepID=A0A9D6LBC6_UNCEI|nr:phenylacetate-CoA oxygenase subunit PaaI [Candidatus Eisenbacteria bacterium]MBI3539549.1 phenylacetate-CoA oxygenase subunit PaaI [Candidatus Eisenbacteria bacterium]